MNTYKTTEIASIIQIHPNTVRLYEKLGLIEKPKRESNGYRVFTDLHIEQFKFARTALQIEVLQNGLRKKVIEIIKNVAKREFDNALDLTNEYLSLVEKEKQNAEEAIKITEQLLLGDYANIENISLSRKDAADYLNISIDTLRNWEMNGLLQVKRKQNGYRVYDGEDIRLLKVIRSLRCANYSLSSILRLMSTFSQNAHVNIRKIIDTPTEEDIISVGDKLYTALQNAEDKAKGMLVHIKYMKETFDTN